MGPLPSDSKSPQMASCDRPWLIGAMIVGEASQRRKNPLGLMTQSRPGEARCTVVNGVCMPNPEHIG